MAIQTIPQGTLAERALKVDLSIGLWEGRRTDRRISDAGTSSYGADNDVGTATKYLIDPAVIKPGRDIMIAAGVAHRKMTLPWDDAGWRIILGTTYPAYVRTMRQHETDFAQWVAGFLPNFDGYVQAWKPKLNGLFRQADYPSRDKLERSFRFEVRGEGIGLADDFRTKLTEDDRELVKRQIERANEARMREAMMDVAARVRRVTGLLIEGLASYQPPRPGERARGAFHDTLVENVRELAALLPTLNLTGDPRVDQLAESLRTDLCKLDAVPLKASRTAREETVKAAEAILEQVNQWIA